MGYSQSYISKMCTRQDKYVPSIAHMTEEQKIRKYVIDTIKECKPLIKDEQFDEIDIAYIKLLDYCLVDREQIQALYYNITPFRITNAFRNKKVGLTAFEPQLIGLTEEEYNIFLENII